MRSAETAGFGAKRSKARHPKGSIGSRYVEPSAASTVLMRSLRRQFGQEAVLPIGEWLMDVILGGRALACSGRSPPTASNPSRADRDGQRRPDLTPGTGRGSGVGG